MSETTIAQPLSGTEIIEAVCEEIRATFYRDCHMNANLAYESFEADISVKVRMKDCGRVIETQASAHVQEGEELGEEYALEQAEGHLYERAPNQVRQDAGLPVPTLVTDAEGRQTIKNIRYGKSKPII